MRSKEQFENYVCPYCLYPLDKCICEIYPPYNLIHIDKNIQEHIRILNEKGYRTMYCCEGHGTGSNTYIYFTMHYFNDIEPPKGFEYKRKKTMVSYSYSTKLKDEEAEEIKKDKLKSLLEWCKELPDRNMEK